MTTLKDILRDFQMESMELVNDSSIEPDEFLKSKEDLIEDYIELIKKRLIG